MISDPSRRGRRMFGLDLRYWHILDLHCWHVLEVTFLALGGVAAILLPLSVAAVWMLEAENERPRQAVLAEHQPTIRDELRPFAGTKFDFGVNPNSAEQMDFMIALQPVLVAAGWVNRKWSDGHTHPSPLTGNQQILPIFASIFATNIEIHSSPENREQLKPAVTALAAALNNIGIVATADEGHDVVSINFDAVHIWVGEKKY
jgi:hypothetical protein